MAKELVTKPQPITPALAGPAGSLDLMPGEYRTTYAKLLQAGSDEVKEGTHNPGAYIVNGTGEVLGDKQRPFDSVVLGITQSWVVSEVVVEGNKKKSKWLRNEPVTPENERRRWNEVINGTEYSYDRTYWLYLLPVSEASEDDFAITEPVCLRCGSTKSKAAMDIKKRLAALQMQKGLSPIDVVWRFGTKKEESKDGETWLGIVAQPVRKTTEQERTDAGQWLGFVRALIASGAHAESGPVEKEVEAVMDMDDDLTI